MRVRFSAHRVRRLRSYSANLPALKCYSRVKICEGTIVQPLSAILYDLDGTIAETDSLHFIVWQECLKEFGIEIDQTTYNQRMSGKTNAPIVLEFLPHLTLAEAEALGERKEARFRELADQLQPTPGLRALIDWAKRQSLKQAVVTNAPSKNAQHILKALKLNQTFDLVVVADVLGVWKPDPAPYLYALEQFGLEPNQAIAFEDSPSGIRSAVTAGIPTIGITSGQTPKDLYDLGVKLAIADFTAPELWAVLK